MNINSRGASGQTLNSKNDCHLEQRTDRSDFLPVFL
jgi:hypothetical protein